MEDTATFNDVYNDFYVYRGADRFMGLSLDAMTIATKRND